MTLFNKLFNAFTYKVYARMMRSEKGKVVLKWEQRFLRLVNFIMFFLFGALYWSVATYLFRINTSNAKYFVVLFGALFIMVIVLINKPIRRNLKRHNPAKRYLRETKRGV